MGSDRASKSSDWSKRAIGVAVATFFLLMFGTFFSFKMLSSTHDRRTCAPSLTTNILDKSIERGAAYVRQSTKKTPIYLQYDLRKKTAARTLNPMQLAGSTWLTAKLHRLGAAGLRDSAATGLTQLIKKTRIGPTGRYLVSRSRKHGRSGTMALIVLAMIESKLSGSLPRDIASLYERTANEILRFLSSSQKESDGLWHRYYHSNTGKPFGGSDITFDGQILLAYTMAARYLSRSDLRSQALQSAAKSYERHFLENKKNPDRVLTYYYWIMPALHTLATSGWAGTEKIADQMTALTKWVLANTNKNPGELAYRHIGGLSLAYHLATLQDDTNAQDIYGCEIDRYVSETLQKQLTPQDDPRVTGAFIQHRHDNTVNLLTSQSTLLSLSLSRRYLYR